MKNISNYIKTNYKAIILILVVSIITISTGIYIFNRNGILKFNKETGITNNKVNESDNKLKEYGLIKISGVYTLNMKLEDFVKKLESDYMNLYSENYSVDISVDDNGWYNLTLSSSKEYIGGNIYIMEAKNKLFKPISLHNDYIKEIELSYNTTSSGGKTDITFVLYKDFLELSGVNLDNKSDINDYIECKQNVLGNILSSNYHWRYDDFDLAIQFASPGSYIYGLPRNNKKSQNGISYNIKVTEEYDTQKCNNISYKNMNENDNIDNSSYYQQVMERI